MADPADVRWMRRAIGLARPRVGLTGTNPAVGCVIVRKGEVIGEAATAEGGRPHAEEQALALAGEEARGGVACLDPSPKASRRGLDRLSAAGVLIEEGSAAELYTRYVKGLSPAPCPALPGEGRD